MWFYHTCLGVLGRNFSFSTIKPPNAKFINIIDKYIRFIEIPFNSINIIIYIYYIFTLSKSGDNESLTNVEPGKFKEFFSELCSKYKKLYHGDMHFICNNYLISNHFLKISLGIYSKIKLHIQWQTWPQFCRCWIFDFFKIQLHFGFHS